MGSRLSQDGVFERSVRPEKGRKGDKEWAWMKKQIAEDNQKHKGMEEWFWKRS